MSAVWIDGQYYDRDRAAVSVFDHGLLYGDGACGFSIAEFDTFARHGIGVVAVVGNDGAWTQIAREQVNLLGDDVGTVLGRAAYHEVACGWGAEGILVRTPTKRLVKMQDIVGAVRFLLENPSVNAIDLRVDGGWMITVELSNADELKKLVDQIRADGHQEHL